MNDTIPSFLLSEPFDLSGPNSLPDSPLSFLSPSSWDRDLSSEECALSDNDVIERTHSAATAKAFKEISESYAEAAFSSDIEGTIPQMPLTGEDRTFLTLPLSPTPLDKLFNNSPVYLSDDSALSYDPSPMDHLFFGRADPLSIDLNRPLSDFDARPIQPIHTEKKEFPVIKQGTQIGKDGPINHRVATALCESLNGYSDKTHVAFSTSHIEDYLEGGTCSAMSFEFAHDYLRYRQGSSPDEAFERMGSKYENSSEEFRTNQTVFNTIRRDKRYPSSDFMKDKIGAMLRAYGRNITDASEMFYYIEPNFRVTSGNAEDAICSFLENHPEGVFVLRCINCEDEEMSKEESYGHSTILIREKGQIYFYDPNEGIAELPNDPKVVLDAISPMMKRWNIPFGRIYKIE